eukprot:CAMPEP_0181088244 /NCGR_PEP_ID=MMETSP1071-20121207/6683_1 /TAXON_ID=35127 /ORGANISM="Thalassiosira sp., Strain NH16" /LENGTH=444 /DNA_ID=CAMNT_0023170147 /DNA_START=252 /DNA_END=1586 /DNA_ORIENTATION=-
MANKPLTLHLKDGTGSPGSPSSGEGRRSRHHVLAVAASVALFWLTVSFIPVYNKYFFSKEYYPYPIATAGIQLGCVSVLLACVNCAQHHCATRGQRKRRNGEGERSFYAAAPSSNDGGSSWVFGPHFLWKFKAVLPIGFLFGIKYGVTNLGLHLISAPTHLLLQSTDLIWTVLGAYFVNGERTSPLGMACLGGCVLGSFVLSVQVGQSASAPVLAITVNLLSPMLLGLCVATLRSACVELMDKRNRVGGTVSAVELTAIKLCISSVVALSLAVMFEGGSSSKHEHGWMDAFRNLPPAVKCGVIGGSILILIFQVNCTYLTHLTSTVAVGLVGQIKIIPQWIVATIFSTHVRFNLTGMSIVGAVLTMTSAAAFAFNEYVVHSARCSDSSKLVATMEDEENGTRDKTEEASPLLGIVIHNNATEYGTVPATTDTAKMHNGFVNNSC